MKDVEIYWNNKELFDNFIKIYNNFEIKNIKKEKISNNNSLCDFFIEDNNNFGKTYIIIYKNFIAQQNMKISNLIDLKITKGIFDTSYKNKINVQCIDKNEIFNLNQTNNFSFLDILFNSTYRNILDNNITIDNKLYKEYIINFESIEEYLTDKFLRNKKLLNDNINEFKY